MLLSKKTIITAQCIAIEQQHQKVYFSITHYPTRDLKGGILSIIEWPCISIIITSKLMNTMQTM